MGFCQNKSLSKDIINFIIILCLKKAVDKIMKELGVQGLDNIDYTCK